MRLLVKITTIGILAALLVLVLRKVAFEIYLIPSDSMENTLVKNDIIVVNQLSRHAIVQGDIVVFRRFENLYVVKRCVAMAGETIQLKKGLIFLNEKYRPAPDGINERFKLSCVKKSHFFNLTDTLNRIGKKFDTHLHPHYLTGNFNAGEIKKLKMTFQVNAEKLMDTFSLARNLYFANDHNRWTLDDMGPLVVPKAGLIIKLTPLNYEIYRKTILEFEEADIKYIKGKYFLKEKTIGQYRFKNDYCFVMGDNRKQSEDSRYIGFIPENRIIGKATHILFSTHNDRFQWTRCLKRLK